MSSKQEKIQKLLEMQKKFIAADRARGISAQEYFTPDSDSDFDGYRQEYTKIAMELVDQAHEEKGSHR